MQRSGFGGPIASCEGKERFAKPTTAHKTMRRMKAKKRRCRLNVYRCSHCGGWHIGNLDRDRDLVD